MKRTITFDEWLKAVDDEVWAKAGMSHLDLPDWGYRDAYDDRRSPAAAARSAIRAAKDG